MRRLTRRRSSPACNPCWRSRTPKACTPCSRAATPASRSRPSFTAPTTTLRKVAALAISLVGTTCCLPKLAPLLRDADPLVNQMAEHAMWSIWFRSGSTPEANKELCRGTKAMNGRDFEAALAAHRPGDRDRPRLRRGVQPAGDHPLPPGALPGFDRRLPPGRGAHAAPLRGVGGHGPLPRAPRSAL